MFRRAFAINYSFRCACATYTTNELTVSTAVRVATFPKQRFYTSDRVKRTPFTMKIDTAEFRSIFTTELNTLAEIFSKHGYEIRIVGGAVRDLLDGKKPHDLDFATTATPQQMKEMFEKEQIRMLNNKGEKHGTITPRINDKENFEVTTLRNDVETDGRHAVVEFTTDWEIDAARRDLTINSMFLGFDGTVYDYFNGYEDLKNRRVLFVGDANRRIQEDYLRILRYFRFFGRIAENGNSHDEKTLEAIRQNAAGLKKISGERIWSELNRIVLGNFCEEIVKKMMELGLMPHMGFDSAELLDIKNFERVVRLKEKYTFRAITYIAALFTNEEQVHKFHARNKLSAFERDLAIFLVIQKPNDLNEPKENPLKPFQDLLVTTKLNKNVVRSYIKELFQFHDKKDLLDQLNSWETPTFYVNGATLKEKGVNAGVEMGLVLSRMKELWVASDFKLTEKELIEKLPDVLKELGERRFKKAKTSD